ncbi:5-methyltetrahydropteroyltriglutamate--homocysteine S-methyltransferase [uncultured Enterococcus sp.]|uniref:5-methyltetrahydropteroyltriglutamate-- homocysteine S-methyltransferase n=1 Tax=uncultured Enterococcus sp. TaxID=167972 RepID=UPI0025DEC3AA|nr:5-methyltetrahydropteroyltriglutamate--homocysteine S-methyltransferase [uncultured Enterococcus sp.]
MKTSIVGFPRIGEHRELKFSTERYFRQELTEQELEETARALRKTHWQRLKAEGLDFIPSGDFSFFDTVLDTATLFNIIPQKYRQLGLTELETYFAMARGYQGEKGDVTALAMKKWFNTNYHYMVPEIEDATNIKVSGTRLFDQIKEANELGINTRPTIVGPYTLANLANYTGNKDKQAIYPELIQAYRELFQKIEALGCEWIQIDEPAFVFDLSLAEQQAIQALYEALLAGHVGPKILIQTYFGDVRDLYETLTALPVAGIGLDFVEGRKNLELIERFGFPEDKWLVAGVVNGKNIWRNEYQKTIPTIERLQNKAKVILSTSCSLLHVPYTLTNEPQLPETISRHFAFALEKLTELAELKAYFTTGKETYVTRNQALFATQRFVKNPEVSQWIANLTSADFKRLPELAVRATLQKSRLALPLLPTTTIGSFPQTKEVKQWRATYKKGELTLEDYQQRIAKKIAECIAFQEEIGLDVLVHGEFERNDMVEYFGEQLAGYVFTKKAWVQSYGTRCVKPPIIWGDIYRKRSLTVAETVYAQSLTDKPVKGMLTGPVTILNWSFPREDISLKEATLQLALAIQEEVLELEEKGIKIIQIDEAALREKLPLRKSDWHSQYLEWAIPAFRLVHSQVQPETQIHTHMCYSEFTDIIREIDQMDADVISFEASRSNLAILDALRDQDFKTQVGPGIYDIHSPRIPTVAEMETTIDQILAKLPISQVWINPDCGLKTRHEAETYASLRHLVTAAVQKREEYDANRSTISTKDRIFI